MDKYKKKLSTSKRGGVVKVNKNAIRDCLQTEEDAILKTSHEKHHETHKKGKEIGQKMKQ